MPGGDKTGPRGEGSKTGRGLGYCADYDQPGWAAPQPGQGLGLGFRWGGRGRGRGRGLGNRFAPGFWPGRWRDTFSTPPVSQDEAINDLKAQAEEMQKTLRKIQDRLDGLE